MEVVNTHMLWVWLVWSVKSACQRPTSHACERVAPSSSSMPSRAGVKTAAYQVQFRGAVKTFPPPHEALGTNGSLKAGACVDRIRNTDSRIKHGHGVPPQPEGENAWMLACQKKSRQIKKKKPEECSKSELQKGKGQFPTPCWNNDFFF